MRPFRSLCLGRARGPALSGTGFGNDYFFCVYLLTCSIVVFRDGVGETQIPMVKENEVPQGWRASTLCLGAYHRFARQCKPLSKTSNNNQSWYFFVS